MKGERKIMKKALLLGLGISVLAMGGIAATASQSIALQTKADDPLGLYLVGDGIKANGNTYTGKWTTADPIATATYSNGYYTLDITFNETGGKFKFLTSDAKWFGMSEYIREGNQSYPGLDLGQLGWSGDGTNITVTKAGAYSFRFAKETIDNTASDGDIFHAESTRVTKTKGNDEDYIYFSMGSWYGTEAWKDNTVYAYSFGEGVSGQINAWPGRKAEPVGYGLYRILVSSTEMGNKLMWASYDGSNFGQFEGGMDYSSANKFYLHDNERTYSANITGDQAGAVILADYFLDKVTDGCDKDGITPLNKTKWDYIRGVSATLGDGAIAAFKNASAEIVAGSSRVLDAKARYQYIVDKAAYSSYEDYFGMRTGAGLRIDAPLAANDSSALTPIVITSVSVAALGGLFLLRKKRAE